MLDPHRVMRQKCGEISLKGFTIFPECQSCCVYVSKQALSLCFHLQDEEKKHSEVALFSTLSHSKSREEALLFGSLTFLPFNTTYNFSSSSFSNSSDSPSVLAFLRSWGCVQFLVLLNVWPEPLSLDPSWAPSLPEKGVFVASTEMNHMGSTSLYSVKLQPYEAVVIKLFKPGGYSQSFSI